MKNTIILARHGSHAELGHTLSGRSEIELNDLGHAEAAALAERLAARPLAAIYASPRQRARDTAAPVAARCGVPVHIEPALDEIDFGAFAGRSFAALDCDPDWQRWNAERDAARCPGGETMAEAVARATAFLDGLPETTAPTLCVTHCDVIRGLVAASRGRRFDHIFAIACAPASLTVMQRDGDRWCEVSDGSR